MIITGKVEQEFHIDPKEVIQKLLSKALKGGYIQAEGGQFYRVTDVSAGRRASQERELLNEEQLQYIVALQLVLNNLEGNESGR